MIDYFALAISHGLLALAALRLTMRADLDRDPEPASDPGAPPAPQAKPLRHA